MRKKRGSERKFIGKKKGEEMMEGGKWKELKGEDMDGK
jgi:hypothetical protein